MSSAVQRRWVDAVGWGLVAIAIYLPCRYLMPIGASYYVDWENHEWAIGYFGEFFRNHHSMPMAFNTPGLGGLAGPVFYGNLFYPLLGVPSSVLAPGVVIRICAASMFVAQYSLVSHALRRLEVPRYLARAVGCIVIWATYPLTNLYNRSALTEFFATTLLVCALSALVLLVHGKDARERRLYGSGMMFSLTVAAGSHPITALCGVPVFAALGPLFWWMLRDDKPRRIAILRSLAPWLGAAIACIVPWYLAVSRFGDALAVRGLSPVTYFPDSIDSWQTRFYPIPWDRRVAPGVSLDQVSTPYLDSQLSLSLLMVFLMLGALAMVAFRRQRARGPVIALALSVGFFLFVTWLSLSPTGFDLLPNIAQMIQFAYRVVTYANLALLLGIFVILIALRHVRGIELPEMLGRRAVIAVVTGSLLLGAVGVVVKWGHIAAVKGKKSSPHWILDDDERRALIGLPASYYGSGDYATPGLFTVLAEELGPQVLAQEFTFDAANRFGLANAMHLDLSEPTWVMTNIQAFPWSVFAIDDQDVLATDLRMRNRKIALQVPAGRHKVTVRFLPERSWRILRSVSLLALYSWSLYLLSFAGRAAWRGIRSLRRRGAL